MNDSLIVFERIDTATVTPSAGSDANYPLVNLQDGRYATQWKSGGTTQGQTLKIDFGSQLNVTSLLIANHNLAALNASSIVLEYDVDDDPNFATPVTAVANIAVTSIAYHTFTPIGIRRYWRIKFNKASALSAAPMIGMIFLGKEALLPLYLNNPKRGLKVDLIRDESLSGLRYASASSAPRQTWKFDWSLKKTPNADFWRWLDSVGVGLHPFWMRDMDDHWHFVRNDFDNVESGGKGNVSFDWRNIQMSEERVGIPIELPGGYTV